MKKEKFLELLNKLEIPADKWVVLNELDSIQLANGRMLVPDWRHCKFYYNSSRGMLYVRYGLSKPYGARLPLNFQAVSGNDYVIFQGKLQIEDTEFYENFRNPQVGDVIRCTSGKTVFGEALITDIKYFSNQVFIKFSNSIFFEKEGKFSFYDGTQYDSDSSAHSNPYEGIYLKFQPNEFPKKSKICGGYHESFKVKNIKDVYLKLGTISGKIYKV